MAAPWAKKAILIKKDLSLSTDGIFTFSPFQLGEQEAVSGNFILDFLLKDQCELGNERMFAKKLYQLEGNYNVKPTDDLGIVRLVLNPSTANNNDKHPTRKAC